MTKLKNLSIMNTNTTFKIRHGNGETNGNRVNGNYCFETFNEARDAAKKFKDDPKASHPNMTEDNVKYWKSQSYTIIKVITTTEILEVI